MTIMIIPVNGFYECVVLTYHNLHQVKNCYVSSETRYIYVFSLCVHICSLFSLFNGKLNLHRLHYQFSPLLVPFLVDAIYINILQVKETRAGHHGRRRAASACCPVAGGPPGAGGGGGGAAPLLALPFLHAVQAVAGAHPSVCPREARRACPPDSEAGGCALN